MKKVLPNLHFMVAVLCSLTACRDFNKTKGANPDELARRAMDAVASFHAQLTQSRYDDLCKLSDQRAYPTSVPCAEYLTYVHGKLGNVLEAMRTDGPHVVDRPAGETVRVELKYATRYEHGLALEHFGWRIGGAQPFLYSYGIESNALR